MAPYENMKSLKNMTSYENMTKYDIIKKKFVNYQELTMNNTFYGIILFNFIYFLK